MKKTVLSDELVASIVEKIESSDRKADLCKYISETTERCAALCEKGEQVRVLNEYKIMLEVLKKKFDL